MTDCCAVKLSEDSSLLYYRQYLNTTQADELLAFADKHFPWVQSQINMFGKSVAIPRMNAWFGTAAYRYSGTRFDPQPLPQLLEALREKIAHTTGEPYNSLLANLYRDGSDCVGWHSDDEQSLGSNPQIASVSLGATRRFVLREKCNHKNKHEIRLQHGSLLLMRGNCQLKWQHCVPKMRRISQNRINLTFRNSKNHPH